MKVITSVVIASALAFAPVAAVGSEDVDASRRAASCACDASEELGRVVDGIRSVDSVERARELATRPISLAGRALSQASWLVPGGSEDLERAQRRIADYEARVGKADTPDEVATAFEGMFMTQHAAMLPPVNADLGDDGCDYSGGEIIATVLGFVLGIIPGIILLILLC